jgi:hypothetical protein
VKARTRPRHRTREWKYGNVAYCVDQDLTDDVLLRANQLVAGIGGELRSVCIGHASSELALNGGQNTGGGTAHGHLRFAVPQSWPWLSTVVNLSWLPDTQMLHTVNYHQGLQSAYIELRCLIRAQHSEFAHAAAMVECPPHRDGEEYPTLTAGIYLSLREHLGFRSKCSKCPLCPVIPSLCGLTGSWHSTQRPPGQRPCCRRISSASAIPTMFHRCPSRISQISLLGVPKTAFELADVLDFVVCAIVVRDPSLIGARNWKCPRWPHNVAANSRERSSNRAECRLAATMKKTLTDLL